ncbi:MAG TPA: molecular chaperone DnaK [Polyangia bacterium]|nr:molecular chaperone DnaK [Polyangia bacterium]
MATRRAPTIGIDLGTTNSCVAVLEQGAPVVIHNQEGARTTPSMVAFTDGGVLVGATAKRQAVMNAARTVFGAKRLLGRRFDSPEVQRLRAGLPYPIVRGPTGDAWIRIGERALSPQEISALVLEKMRQIAEDYLGCPVKEAIVTVPAYFDDAQRQATKDAGRIAGLEVRRILNEPTAAALAYGVHKSGHPQKLAVVDLGGGTFDVSILQVEDGVFEVLAIAGDTALGGDDVDRRLVGAFAAAIKHESGADTAADPMALQRLKEAAEKAKHELSETLVSAVNLPFVAQRDGQPVHFQHEIRRRELETLTGDLVAQLEPSCQRALEDARIEPRELDHVILVGGMTRMPAVQQRIEAIFGRPPSKGVNPDEIVAVGAATQSAILEGALREVVLLDVTPHALGIRAEGDRMSVIIPRNCTVPTREHKIFATTQDDQTLVTIEMFQGDEVDVRKNRSLGEFTLGGLPRAGAGEIHVEVAFTVDVDGILHVSAQEMATGRAASIKVSACSGLPPSEVARLAAARKH